MSIMGALFAASIGIAILFEVCCAGSLPLYGVNFAVLYNHSSASVPARRFPDQDSIPMDDYEYFSDLNINGVINGSIVIGAKNALYQLDQKLALESKFSWAVNSTTEESCLAQLHPRAVCQNHIRKYQKIPSSSSHILVCGTVADISPECVTMDVSSGRLSNTTTSSITVDSSMTSFISDSPSFGEFIDTVGTGTSNMDNRYFATGVGDSIRDFIIAYLNVSFDPNSTQPLTITRSIMARSTDTFLMRHPVTFVDYYRADYPDDQTDGDREFYFVFMRESYRIIQSEASYETIFSRVIRLCRNDRGNTSGNYISSFVKARIFCNLESPNRNRSVNTVDLQYNVITSMAFNSFGRFYERADERRAMYGAFISSGIGPTGSAICVYGASIGDADGIYEVFTEDVLDFSSASPSPVQNEFATCRNQRSDVSARYYIRTSSIIGQIESSPLLVLDKIRVTQVAVDNLCVIRRTSSTECRNQDILILGTASGSIIKTVIASTDSRLWDPVISEEIQLDDRTVSVNDLKLQTIGGEKVAIVSTDSKIYQISLARCGRHDACSTCIGSRDPYCVWNTNNQMCEINRLVSSQAVTSNFRQNIHTESTFPRVYFLETMYFVNEEVDMITLTLNISSPQSSDAIVEVFSVDQTAQAGLDYMVVNETLMIMAGMISASVNVYMLRDNSLEAKNESFNIRIRGIGTFCIISGEDATLVIQDTNNVTLSFESSSVQVREDAGSVILVVTWNVEMSTVDINFNVTIRGVTAIAYKDYCADSKQQYRIPAGSSSSQDISITIMKDNILEASETFIATIELTDNPGLQSRLSTGISQTVVTIQDDDSNMENRHTCLYSTRFFNAILGGINFAQNEYRIAENEGSVNLLVNRFTNNSVNVELQIIPLSASAGEDYMSTSTITHILTHSSQTDNITIQIMDDGILEAHEETFIVILLTRDLGISVKGNSTAIVIIQDNDANSFSLYYTTFNLQKYCDYFNATVTRTGTSDLPIELILSMPSLTSNSIPPWNLSIVFQPMQLTTTVVIPIIEENQANDGPSLILSPGPISEPLKSRLLFRTNRTLATTRVGISSTLATTRVGISSTLATTRVGNDMASTLVTIIKSFAEDNSSGCIFLFTLLGHFLL